MSGLHVESSGEGPPLALLHGWAMHAGVFDGWLGALAGRHRVLAVDLPGHGRSADVGARTLDAVVDAVARALAGIGEALTLVGWSYGGQVALRWAAREPKRVRRIALVASSPRFVDGDGWAHAMPAATLDAFADGLAGAPEATLARFQALQVHGGERAREALATLRELARRHPAPSPADLAAALAILRGADLRRDATAIRAPTLVVCGDRDAIAPPAASRWLAQAIGGARLATIPGAAHVPFLTHADALAGAVDGFLDGR